MKANLLTTLFIGALLTVSCAKEAPANAVRINNLWWSTMNVGATTPQAFGGYYTWDQAQTACPSGWRLPTSAEFKALYSNVADFTPWESCPTGAWSALSGVTGSWAGPGAKSANPATAIFFPASGLRSYSDGSFYYVGSDGFYWSSVPNGSSGYSLYFDSSTVGPQNYSTRTFGFPVRCVQ